MRFGGIGAIYALPTGANPTPIPIAIAKSAQLDVKQDLKLLRGQWAGAIDAFKGPLDVSVKLANSDFSQAALGMVLQGSTSATGSSLIVAGEAGTVPAPAGPYTIQVVNFSAWTEDGGVMDLTSAKRLTRVASAPASGEYSVAAGVYTFNSADTGHSVVITYRYSTASTATNTRTLNNQVMGASTGYLVRVFQNFTVNGVTKSAGWELPWVHFSNFSLGYKAEDWSESSLEGMAVADPTTTLILKAFAD